MADFIMFTEGKNLVETSGFPATCSFDLSTSAIGTGLVASTTFAGGYGVATGTGYAAQTQSRPAASSGALAFSQMSFATGSATDWPSGVVSLVCRNANTLICAWHLQAGGTPRAMNAANTTENVTPTFSLT